MWRSSIFSLQFKVQSKKTQKNEFKTTINFFVKTQKKNSREDSEGYKEAILYLVYDKLVSFEWLVKLSCEPWCRIVAKGQRSSKGRPFRQCRSYLNLRFALKTKNNLGKINLNNWRTELPKVYLRLVSISYYSGSFLMWSLWNKENMSNNNKQISY